jgi:hypothetical protein
MDVNGLKKDDNIIMFDAGGGTVDIISLRVNELSKSVELIKSVPGDGQKYESVFLNRSFRKWLIDNYSMLEGWDDIVLQEAVIYFEDYIKKHFSGTESYRVPIMPLEDNPSRNIVRGCFLLSPTEVEAIFSPVVVVAATAILLSQLK